VAFLNGRRIVEDRGMLDDLLRHTRVGDTRETG